MNSQGCPPDESTRLDKTPTPMDQPQIQTDMNPSVDNEVAPLTFPVDTTSP